MGLAKASLDRILGIAKATSLFIVGNALIKRTAENSGRRARYTRAMHQNNHSLGRRKRRRGARRNGREKEREMEDSGHLRTYKHATAHTRTHMTRREEKEREGERSNSQQQQQQQQTRRSRNRGTTTPVEALLRSASSGFAPITMPSPGRENAPSAGRTKSSSRRVRNESDSTRAILARNAASRNAVGRRGKKKKRKKREVALRRNGRAMAYVSLLRPRLAGSVYKSRVPLLSPTRNSSPRPIWRSSFRGIHANTLFIRYDRRFGIADSYVPDS